MFVWLLVDPIFRKVFLNILKTICCFFSRNKVTKDKYKIEIDDLIKKNS